MSDSGSKKWNDYLDETERNRGAVASLGLVRYRKQNGNNAIRVLGPRRIVLAFDTDNDDPDLLRTALQLLRASALTANTRSDTAQITTAEEKISEALDQLGTVDRVKQAAGVIHKKAQSIENDCTTIYSGIDRLLRAALDALKPAHAHHDATAQGAA